MEKSLVVTGVPAEGIAKWRAEVESLPLKKQLTWHACCGSIEGTLRRVRFWKGYFQVKVLANTGKGELLLPADGWAPVVAIGESVTPSQILETYDEEMLQKYENMPEIVRPHVEQLVRAYIRGGLDACSVAGIRMILENSTGHHHRNKHVSIPVAPGQPVRG
jgi:hypothetical protein